MKEITIMPTPPIHERNDLQKISEGGIVSIVEVISVNPVVVSALIVSKYESTGRTPEIK
jgi:hypothetical protein